MTALAILFAIMVAWFGAWGWGRQWEKPEIPEDEPCLKRDSNGAIL